MQVTDEADEELLLDLLNTTPVVDGVRSDELGDRAQAHAWLVARGGSGSPGEAMRACAIRDVLQSVVRGESSPTALTPHLAGVGYRPVATDDGLAWALDVAAQRRLAVRAALAWDRLRLTAPGRLRACANRECELFLLDRSKANTARWCSMSTCGNRMKARRHYQRIRQDRP